MSIILRKLAHNNVKHVFVKNCDAQLLSISSRKLSILPSIYDGDKDPAPKFFSSNVQILLKRLTRPDFAKVFRKRTNSGYTVLRTPKYKFLTTEELEAELAAANDKADKLLQMPPVVQVLNPIDDVLSKDGALVGYDKYSYVFTDITFGVPNETRIIVQRDPDGTLHSCAQDVRKRMNQAYFPINGRKIREPIMFSDMEKLHSLLEREKYEFVLDRACIQYEPEELQYQKVTSITYQHVDLMKNYDILRSTRHFGPLAFYLTWHQSMDQLMLELLQTGVVRESVLLAALRNELHSDIAHGDVIGATTHQILSSSLQLPKPESLTEEDIQLDNKCIEVIEKYITGNSSMKAQQELALQGFREHYQQMIELSRGLKKAHGSS